MNHLPHEQLLEAHHVVVAGDAPWQRRLRLMQAIWREEQGLPIGTHPRRGGRGSRPLGSRIARSHAEENLSNYLTETIQNVVRNELKSPASEDRGRLFLKPRIFDDLLSSQPLCFNLFGELKDDLASATALCRHLWPDRVRKVTCIRFEYSPGRGNTAYLGNRSAFDVYLEHTTPDGAHGFIAFEVKYHENLKVGRAETRRRVDEVARKCGVFAEASLAELRHPPLQQLWFDHLLVLSMLDTDHGHWGGNGLFVLVHPVANEACYRVANAYQKHLLNSATFQRIAVEEIVTALQLVAPRPWVDAFKARYLAYDVTSSG